MTTIATDTLTRKVFAADEINFAPGAREFVAWISTAQVDHEGDVVVAEGVDFKSVFLGEKPGEGNPCVLACHQYGTWPLGRCEWVKVKRAREWAGLYAKTVLDDDPETEVVWKKIRNGTIRGISIGFRMPDDAARGEWGPPTADELRKNPQWKGARRVIRRCVLLEYSVVPLPMNPSALITAVAKGVHKPVYPEPPMPDAIDPADEPAVTAAPTDPPTPPDTPTDPPVTKARHAEPDADEEGGDDDGDEDDAPIRNGHFVRVVKGTHRGAVGKVKSVHRAGLIPDVEDDVPVTKADPGLRVNVYKAMGDGFRPSDHHVGCKMAHAERTDDLKPPKARKAFAPAVKAETPLPFDLGPDDLVSDGDARAAKSAELNRLMCSPTFLNAAVKAALDEITGVV